MKRALLLLSSVFFLFGCGGEGSDTRGGATVNNPGGITDGEAGNSLDGPTGNIRVAFSPVQTVQAQSVVDTSAYIRNRARLVVRKSEEVPVLETIYEVRCDEAEPEDCSQVAVGERQIGTQVTDTYKNISDGPLAADGSGAVSIAVPPGAGYTLEVLTYFRDSAIDTNFMLEYGKNAGTFAITAGEATSVSISLTSDLAELVLPAGPILADSLYEVSIPTRSEALRSEWYVRQTLDESDLADEWFLHENSDAADVFGTGSLSLRAPMKTGAGAGMPTWKLWVRGQFFISAHLLNAAESYAWKKWTFGSSYAGALNPYGSVDVLLP